MQLNSAKIPEDFWKVLSGIYDPWFLFNIHTETREDFSWTQTSRDTIIGINVLSNTAQKMKFSIKDFSSKCDQICRKLRIWSHLLEKFLMENFIFGQCKAMYTSL